ncbi:hypothetical protein GYMLUDRAFT_71042 [Collybiopsis luxurians FD-317 M1]|nr:hypothetical protein GYMLUDRAFT_71042 [Collybiopsis luxurians FD-317 M1]
MLRSYPAVFHCSREDSSQSYHRDSTLNITRLHLFESTVNPEPTKARRNSCFGIYRFRQRGGELASRAAAQNLTVQAGAMRKSKDAVLAHSIAQPCKCEASSRKAEWRGLDGRNMPQDWSKVALSGRRLPRPVLFVCFARFPICEC